MPRPTGVSVLAILYWISAFFLAIAGIIIAAGAGMAAVFTSSAWMPMMAGLGAAGAVIFLICAALVAFIGYGLWTMREWARIVTIVLAALSLLGQLAGFFMMGPLMLFFFYRLLRIVIAALIIWYLMQSQIRAAFVRS